MGVNTIKPTMAGMYLGLVILISFIIRLPILYNESLSDTLSPFMVAYWAWTYISDKSLMPML